MWIRKNPDESHLSCFLHDLKPLREDCLSTAELRTILKMSAAQAAGTHNEHRTRTLVSIA